MRGRPLETLIARADAEARESGHRAIFVTDQMDTTLFLKHRVPVEVVPAAGRAVDPGGRAYRDRCLQAIRCRWSPAAVVDVGRPAPAAWLYRLGKA